MSIPLVYAGLSSQARKARVTRTLHDVGLYDKEHRVPNKLSGGQQQRVAIACAIVKQPKFIIADEPMGALESKTTKVIMDLFIKLYKEYNTTMILVTYDRKVADKADRIIHILDGRIQREVVVE